jgi:hypothetical protein
MLTASCAPLQPDGAFRAGGDRPTVTAELLIGEPQNHEGRTVQLEGTVVAQASGAVQFHSGPPALGEEGSPALDPERCIGLLLSREQYERVKGISRRVVTGRFVTRALHEGDTVTTSVMVGGRRTYPFCSNRHNLAPLIYTTAIK